MHFLYISLGSISEVDTQFIISFNLGFISDEKLKEISDKLTLIKSQLLYQLSYECRTI
ncbi:MAG: four helix bundle protein [Ignavibacteriae bacterium]|nr:four helix bundle protein [Ignavibacteriota bacterium]